MPPFVPIIDNIATNMNDTIKIIHDTTKFNHEVHVAFAWVIQILIHTATAHGHDAQHTQRKQ